MHDTVVEADLRAIRASLVTNLMCTQSSKMINYAYVKYVIPQITIFKKRFLLRCIHHFESDIINNIDHMRISGTGPSSVIRNLKL